MRKYNAVSKVLVNVMKKSKILTSGIIIAAVGAVVGGILPPLVLEQIINNLTEAMTAAGKMSDIAIKLVVMYFVMLVIAGLFDALREVLITIFGQRVTKGIRHEMCGKLSRLSAMYYSDNESGRIVSGFVNDVDTVDTLFASGVISMFVDMCKVISILAVIVVKSTGLGLLMLLVTPLIYIYTRYVQKQMLSAQLDNREAVARANNHIPETTANIRTIHVLGIEKYMTNKYMKYVKSGYDSMEKSNLYDAVYSPVIIMLSSVIISVMMVLAAMGGQLQGFFGMSVGTAVAVIAYVGKVFEPLESIGMEIQSIQSAVAGVHRINDFLNEPELPEALITDQPVPEKDITPSVSTPSVSLNRMDKPAIEFRNVCFGYTEGQTVLDNYNMVLMSGESITLAGRTGIGKSTIIKLILGLMSPDKGRVLVNGMSADRIPNCEKRKLFGYVEQSFHMIPGTVEQQITLYDNAITRDEVQKAARLAGLHDRILQLNWGYDTRCESGMFSQGQWQLLSIARAVVADPEILLLDEITANLDSETELQVMRALKNASKNRTVVSVSHRINDRDENIVRI